MRWLLVAITMMTSGVHSARAESLRPDPGVADAWWLNSLRVPEAWHYATGEGVVVAICDSGFYTSSPDLGPNLDLSRARDFSDLDAPTTINDGPYAFHGTASAALIAAVKNGQGTQGLAYNATVLPLQSFNYDEAIDDKDRLTATYDCLRYALRQDDVRVILVQSVADGMTVESDPRIRQALTKAAANNKTVILPAGEMSNELPSGGPRTTGAIVVGALQKDGAMAYYSNFGARVDVSAFGEKVQMLVGPEGQMAPFGGTTSAAAQVAGTVALMLSANPNLSHFDIRNILAFAKHVDDTNEMVGGMLDVAIAVDTALFYP